MDPWGEARLSSLLLVALVSDHRTAHDPRVLRRTDALHRLPLVPEMAVAAADALAALAEKVEEARVAGPAAVAQAAAGRRGTAAQLHLRLGGGLLGGAEGRWQQTFPFPATRETFRGRARAVPAGIGRRFRPVVECGRADVVRLIVHNL